MTTHSEPLASKRPPKPSANRFSPSRLVSTHGLLLLFILLFAVFSILLPDTFPTAYNIRSILANKSVTALLALAVMVPLATGNFDLSVGYVLGLTHVLTVGLQIRSGFPWLVAVLAALAVGVAVGLVNGVLVAYAQIDSFIATLAVGTFVYGISNWYTKGAQIAGSFPDAFINLGEKTVFTYVPLPAIYVLVIATILWLGFEFLPVGRRVYALGGNPRAAHLVGVPVQRYIVGAFATSGLLTACAGVVLASELQAGQSSLGPEYLLPAFVGALLGATTVRPGRVNVWGTLLAVLLLSVGISGLEQEGATFYVEPLFNGATLALAVGIAGYAARRRLRARPRGPAAEDVAEGQAKEPEGGDAPSTT